MAEIKILNSLVEITSYRDKALLEKSLVKTVHDIFPHTQQRLFSVQDIDHSTVIQLVASFCDEKAAQYTTSKPVNTEEMKILNILFEKVLVSMSVEHFTRDDQGMFYSLYPVFDEDNNTFAILLSSSETPFPRNKESLCLGMLQIYSNYLNLLNNTQKDKLTGLYNRETLDSKILHVLHQTLPLEHKSDENKENKIGRRKDNHLNTYLAVIDIDHFKSINDNFGHLYGDEILVLVSRCMTNFFARSEDLVYRYGGEEFVILIQADNEHNAKIAFERLRENIQNYDFPQVGKVTISIGFEKITTQKSSQEVIAAADSALYYAKNNGRNKTEYYQQLVLEGKLKATTSLVSEDVTLF